MVLEITPDIQVRRDAQGLVRHIIHFQKGYPEQDSRTSDATPQALAQHYLKEVAPIYQIDDAMIEGSGHQLWNSEVPNTTQGVQKVSEMADEGSRLRFASEKSVLDSRTLLFRQTYFGLPVLDAGISVRMGGEPPRVTGSQSTVHLEIRVDRPPLDAAFAPDRLEPAALMKLIGLKARSRRPKIYRSRLVIYRYDPAVRTEESAVVDPGSESSILPARRSELPDVPPEIQPGRHYVATEVQFSLAMPKQPELNWHAVLEVCTGAVLYLRGLAAGVSGSVLLRDPISATGDRTLTPAASANQLDPLRSVVPLTVSTPTTTSTPYRLEGKFVRVVDFSPPHVEPPQEYPPGAFNYSVSTDNFAAVSAYHHLDSMFQMVQDFGIDIRRYFDGIQFPVSVDHRATICSSRGCASNIVAAETDTAFAQTLGNRGNNGVVKFLFALAQPNQRTGIAADRRVVIHEFAHALLWDNGRDPKKG